MLTVRNRDELEVKGYTVVENAVPDHARLREAFFEWMKGNFDAGVAPYSTHSIVRHYGVGYLEPAWEVRLQVKKYFAQLWGTEQLLTSVDAVAIGQPPEMGTEEFDTATSRWLHVDQCAARVGLHAYQGAVYLETADADDWTFEVLEGSHEHLQDFYAQNDKARIRSVNTGLWRMRDDDLEWYRKLGCERKRVPVKAGSLLMWDSRLVHANARPIQGRKNPDRWRLIVLVCMGPLAWSTKEDIQRRRKAFKDMLMTTHWPSDDIGIMGSSPPPSYAPQLKGNKSSPRTLPEIATSNEVLQLVGIVPYKNDPAAKVPAWRPRWDPILRPDMARLTSSLYVAGVGMDPLKLTLLVLLAALVCFCGKLIL
ncbi:hypothetical protein Btru_043246 [Bulinus truncatus]|nr:hypothetical protein Btru_043246 [Bulinus truncatus]